MRMISYVSIPFKQQSRGTSIDNGFYKTPSSKLFQLLAILVCLAISESLLLILSSLIPQSMNYDHTPPVRRAVAGRRRLSQVPPFF